MASVRKKNHSNISGSKETTVEILSDYLLGLTDLVIGLYILAMFIGLPFYMTDGYNRLGTDKAEFFREWSVRFWKVFAALFAAYLLVRVGGMIYRRTLEPLRKLLKSVTVSEWFLIAFLGSIVISARFSEFPETARWGTTGWFIGLIPQAMSIGAYFAVNRISRHGNLWALSGLLASATVFLIGYFNRFGLLRIAETTDTSRLSTIGNINWYCGYLILWLAAGIGIYYQLEAGMGIRRIAARIAMALYLILVFGTLFTQVSASGYVALAALALILIGISGKSAERLGRSVEILLFLMTALNITWFICRAGRLKLNETDAVTAFLSTSVWIPIMGAVVLVLYLLIRITEKSKVTAAIAKIGSRAVPILAVTALVCFVVLLCYNTRTGELTQKYALGENHALTFNDEWGSKRGATWGCAARIYRDQSALHRIVGVGPDCFYDAYSGAGGETAEIIGKLFSRQRLTNAHSEFLTILVNMGILGVITFGGFTITSIVRLIRAGVKDPKRWAALAGGLVLAAYTANNIFSFQQTIQMITMYLMLGLAERAAREAGKKDEG